MAGDDQELNFLLSSSAQAAEDLNNILYKDVGQSQPEYFAMDENLQPTQQLRLYEENVNHELSIEEIQRILDLPSSTLQDLTQNVIETQRKERQRSICISSPESGISGCGGDEQMFGSPHSIEQVQSPYEDNTMDTHDPGTISVTASDTFAQYDTSRGDVDHTEPPHNYFEHIDMTSLLELAKESDQLMASSESDLQYLTASKQFVPAATDNLVHRPEHQATIQNKSATVLTKIPSTNMGSSTDINNKTFITKQTHWVPGGKDKISPTPSVIVTNSNAVSAAYSQQHPPIATHILPTNTATYTYEVVSNTASNFSIPGSMVFNNLEPPKDTSTTTEASVPITILEMNVPVVDNKPLNTKDNKPKEEAAQYVCYVCGEKAGKHSYYGGQVCASCRAFFRRSVQSKYYEIFQCKKDKQCKINSETRKNCQFCRFKKCLESGMKTSWVLSDEERNRRFNKFNKLSAKTVSVSDKKIKKLPPSRIPELYLTFTIEEHKMLEDVHKKFQVCQKTWLKNVLLMDRNAGVNFIEAAYKVSPLKKTTFKVLERAFHLYFVQNVVPQFVEMDHLPTQDRGHIINGRSSGMAHLFKSSQCLKIKEKDEEEEQVCKKESELCPLQKQVNDLASNPGIVESLDLSEMMSKLDLAGPPKFPTYQEIYPDRWANDSSIEQRHFEIMNRIKNWPKNEHNEVDLTMVLLMTLMLMFSVDYEGLINRSVVESVQLKYSMLLQRYLRYKMRPDLANNKFLEAMLLLSYTREIWEINNKYQQRAE